MSYGKTFTRGGQVTLHNLRMFRQVANVTLVIAILVSVFFFGLKTYLDTTVYQRNVLLSYVWATIKLELTINKGKPTQDFQQPNGQWITIKSLDIKNHPSIKRQVDQFERKVIQNGLNSGWLFLTTIFLIGCFWVRRGNAKKEKEILSGTEVVDAEILAKIIKNQGNASDYTLAGVPLIKNKELQHILVAGTTGAGKTNCFHELLQQIRSKNQRAIVVDVTGDYIEKYYRPGKDKILNPLDERSEPWNIWGECPEPFHLDNLSAALFPQQTKESFWSNAARTIFSVTAQNLRELGSTSTKDLLEYTTMKPLHELQDFYADTKAAALMDPKSKETVSSIRSTLAVSIQCLEHLEDTHSPFSIRDWIREDEGEGWLFLSTTPEMRETLKPLLSTWVAVATKSLMGLKPSPDRRLWFVIDELPALNKLPDFQTMLAEARKYGGCVLAGTQDLSLLDEIYGYNLVKSISNLCSTKVVFRIAGSDVADRMSKWLGTQEISESVEHISYGAHQMRDGVSLNDQRKEKAAVNADKLMKLPDLEGYLKVPGDYPIAKVKFEYQELKNIAARLVPQLGNGGLKIVSSDNLSAIQETS